MDEKQAAGDGRQATGHGGDDEDPSRLRKGADIAERLVALACAVLTVTRGMRRDDAGRHVALQIVRSVTSAGANYEEARAAESRADFVHKVQLAAKEMRETIYWLRLIRSGALAPAVDGPRLDASAREARELAAILVASARTARRDR